MIQVKDEMLAKMARTKLGEYMGALKKSFPYDHQVSLDASPYSIISISADVNALSVAELYKNYPLPGEALVYDIINTTVNRMVNDVEKSLSLPHS